MAKLWFVSAGNFLVAPARQLVRDALFGGSSNSGITSAREVLWRLNSPAGEELDAPGPTGPIFVSSPPPFLSFTEEIESLPLANTPEVFGLHSNAEIGYYTQAARDMWSHLLELQPQTGMALGHVKGPSCRLKHLEVCILNLTLGC